MRKIKLPKEEQREIKISIETPEYHKESMFFNRDQVINTYKFLCSRYVKHLKKWEIEQAKRTEKLISDYVVMWEGQWYKEFKDILNIK